MHYKNVNGILSNQNTMNLYRGCQHGCIYCDSRSACYHFDHDFEDIEVKENALVLLENCLKHKRKKCMIQMGSMCDPYMPLENELNHVRKALELIDHYGFGVTLITKSDLVLRDVDLLKKINQKTKCVVQMTLTTYDEELCQKLEPHVCTTKKRIEVLKELNKQGIPTIVWLTPILPFINDTKENIVAILKGCFEAGVKGVICFGMGVTLREGSRDYYYQQLDQLFPGMKEKYQSTYNDQYTLNSPHNRELMNLFFEKCQQYHMMCNYPEIFAYLQEFETKIEVKEKESHSFEQLSLF